MINPQFQKSRFILYETVYIKKLSHVTIDRLRIVVAAKEFKALQNG